MLDHPRFELEGRCVTEAAPFRQRVDDYIACQHSRASFAPDVMGPELAREFDELDTSAGEDDLAALKANIELREPVVESSAAPATAAAPAALPPAQEAVVDDLEAELGSGAKADDRELLFVHEAQHEGRPGDAPQPAAAFSLGWLANSVVGTNT